MPDEPQQSAEQESQEPLASVLIVSHNRVEALRRCLAALDKSAERKRLDIIVLDLGSRDGSATLDQEFEETAFLRMPRNFGATKVLNIGIRNAKSDRLFFLDPAVEVEPGTIGALLKFLDGAADAGAACPLLVSPQGQPVPQFATLPDRAALSRLWQDPASLVLAAHNGDAPVSVEFAGRKSLLARKSFLKGMNYFDEKYGEFGGDLELAFQIRHAGKKTYVVPAIRATDHSASEKQPSWNNAQRAMLAADRLNGVAHFVGKRSGMMAEIMVRVSAILGALLRALTFQSPGYNWSLLTALIGGQKIDGSQGNV